MNTAVESSKIRQVSISEIRVSSIGRVGSAMMSQGMTLHHFGGETALCLSLETQGFN